MRIKTIPRSEFDRWLPHNPALENWMVKQVEWFSNGSGMVVRGIDGSSSLTQPLMSASLRIQDSGYFSPRCSARKFSKDELL